MSTEREPIAVIGTGYVGLVTAAGFAELGSEVWCVDVDADKIARLKRGEIPIYEPGLAESVARNRERLHFSTELAPALEHARLLFVAVGTPPTYSGDADLSAVHAVVDAMPASDRHALVMKSTVPVGTGAAIKRIFAEQGKDGFAYVSCPEFLKEGSALEDFLEPDRVVIGDDGDWAGDAVVELYAPLDAPLVRTDIASAEMVKLAANAFLATKISFINEIANVCEETGADVLEVARGMGLDQRIGTHFLQARDWVRRVVLSQGCLGAQAAGRQLRLPLPAADRGDRGQRAAEAARDRQAAEAPRLAGRQADRAARAGVQGQHRRHARGVVAGARRRGCRPTARSVRAYDPVAEQEARKLMTGVEFADSALEAVDGRRRCVIVTEWPEFARARLGRGRAERMAGRLVVDGRNFVDPEAVARRPASSTRASGADRPGTVQALILAGGEGTRLRPLTSTMPKPVVPLVGRPFISYMLEWLRGHGVDEAILSCGFMADGVRARARRRRRRSGCGCATSRSRGRSAPAAR